MKLGPGLGHTGLQLILLLINVLVLLIGLHIEEENGINIKREPPTDIAASGRARRIDVEPKTFESRYDAPSLG